MLTLFPQLSPNSNNTRVNVAPKKGDDTANSKMSSMVQLDGEQIKGQCGKSGSIIVTGKNKIT